MLTSRPSVHTKHPGLGGQGSGRKARRKVAFWAASSPYVTYPEPPSPSSSLWPPHCYEGWHSRCKRRLTEEHPPLPRLRLIGSHPGQGLQLEPIRTDTASTLITSAI